LRAFLNPENASLALDSGKNSAFEAKFIVFRNLKPNFFPESGSGKHFQGSEFAQSIPRIKLPLEK
jgi:hypothetical protein